MIIGQGKESVEWGRRGEDFAPVRGRRGEKGDRCTDKGQ